MNPDVKVGAPTQIPVRMADLKQFANRKCGYCFGSGERSVTEAKEDLSRKPMKSGRSHKIRTVSKIPCTCGLRKFLAVQMVHQDKATGRLYFAEPVIAWSAEGQRLHVAQEHKEKEAAEASSKGSGDVNAQTET
jgi:hypothetical protein